LLITHTRRGFLSAASLAGVASVIHARGTWADEPPSETTTVRLGKMPVICFAPQYVCETMLHAEGFTDVRYIDTTMETQEEDLGRGKFDFHSNLSLAYAIAIDRGLPITVLTGLHAGCYELFAHGGIRSIADLKGKTVGQLGGLVLISMMAAYVGLDRKRT
jgi:NitT/TauT family transport system substrate-binding protein